MNKDEYKTRRIRPLDPTVVNKIAAGEVIERPENAVKELLENALDAGSTSIEVLLKDGGLKLLQISDNGSGIHYDDLPYLCQRFSTSKLEKFEDLQQMRTFGFRGEALASISHVAKVTITTKREGDVHAWRAFYVDGKLAPLSPSNSPAPQPCAGKQGTVITVEDLFYNVPGRKAALKHGSEEYRRVLNLVQKYAIHSRMVSFTCKKVGETVASVSLSSRLSTKDKIRHVYGTLAVKHLKVLNIAEGATNVESFHADGLISSADYEDKKSVFILFINNRLVESIELKTAIDETYSKFLHKGASYFVYLSLVMKPEQLDVNVHPSKRIVHFLYDHEIFSAISEKLVDLLQTTDEQRSYAMQTTIPSITMVKTPELPSQKTKKIYENNLVRTDPRERSIKAMFSSSQNAATFKSNKKSSLSEDLANEETQVEPLANPTPSLEAGLDEEENEVSEDKTIVPCELESIRQLQNEVLNSMHLLATNILSEHKYVGLVCPYKRIAAVQHNIGLYLVDYAKLAYHLFYQICLTEFANYGKICMNPPIPLNKLFFVSFTKDELELSEKTRKLLVARRDMLHEYFSIEISTEGFLNAMPCLSKSYRPYLTRLPLFLKDIAPDKVDWLDERSCLDGIMKALAKFYVPVRLSPENTSYEDITYMERLLEEFLFPEFRRRLICPKELFEQMTIFQVTSLPRLYTVFERC
ncbi:MutL family protein Mlh1 [Schizosaccharomyces cryophilus OY26]|uniref:MutL family protein Mlh1 n=1 Tax=Schizosaccharomyces cryophilus (strain OY26 / ATCC MYA-4695 / CBS 11777 / NBRC 106824 / NRRL Y48691) TaxID=653667 RepID=S9W5E6_SCHCR|nr:MutL family protein Mlh1 [Schizosaccharomyces cryophilus OY26]EPY53794.1 MutL family protein Mlh1 [Schizosaccharomyces cryophilus OY26]